MTFLATLALLMIMGEPAQTSTPALYVATYVDVQVGSINQGIELIKQYRQTARAESGNSGVDVVQEISRPNHFVIIEFWKDQPAFDAHEKAASTAQFRARLKAIHNSPYDQRVHQALAADSRPLAIGRGTVSAVTHVDVPPQGRQETEVLLKRLAEDSRKDDGNVRYDVFQQTAPRTNHFTVFGTWKDRSAFDAHETKSHTKQFRESLAPMLGAPYDERLFSPLM
jgi:quinol monooxygenase YgiN